jgi:hypothetical protein
MVWSNDHSQNGNQVLLHEQGRSILHPSPFPENFKLPLPRGEIVALGDEQLTKIFDPRKANGYDSQTGQPEYQGSPLPNLYTPSKQFDSTTVSSSRSVSSYSVIHSADEPQMSVTGDKIRSHPYGRKGKPQCDSCRTWRQGVRSHYPSQC